MRLLVVLTVVCLAIGLVPLSATEIGIDIPHGMAFDRSANLFLSKGDSILKFTADGTESTFASGLERPLGLAFDEAGNLFVGDNGTHTVVKFTPDGSKSTFASDIQPAGLAFDSAGNLFAVDTSGSILKFAPEGTKSTFFKTITTKLGSTRLIDPAGPAIDKAGNLFVSDKSSGSATILKFSPDGTHSAFVSGLGNPTPWLLAFDRTGNLFVSILTQFAPDQTTIYKFAPDGPKTVELWRSEGEKFAIGLCAAGMTFDKAGNLFVLDLQSNSILRFAADGTRSTFHQWVESSMSPDKKWAYIGGDESKIVKADTKQMVLDLSDQGRGGDLWAPDSKRLAFNYGRGRSHQTSLYQLRDDHWVALKSPGDGDEIEKRVDDIVARQLKRQGLSERKLEKQGKYLRLIWWTVNVDQWLDSNTAIVHASLRRVAARKDAPGEMDDGYGTDLLFTLKFDNAGNWKIVKTHEMSDKEVKEHE